MADFVGDKHRIPFEVVRDADCVLVIGPERVKAHVNSLFLRAASAPFRAMFRPEWKEGDDVRGQAELVEILLPEDDATAMQLLCAVLHHQNNTIPHKLPVHSVLRIAVAADKYDCIHALKFASESWLNSDWETTSDLAVLAAAAYLLGNAAAFRRITKNMILTHNGSFTAIHCAEVEAVMDWRVISLLEEARSIARLDLANMLIEGINDGSVTCVHKCGWTSKYAYAYMNLLQSRDLWPADLSRQSIADAIAKAKTMSDPIPREASGECKYSYKHSQPEYKRNIQHHLEDLDVRTGLCLDCIKSKSVHALECQLLHQV